MCEIMTTILDTIVADTRRAVAAAKARLPEADLRRRVASAPPVRDFYAALARRGPIRLVAEVKRASPSKGVLRGRFPPRRDRPHLPGARGRVHQRPDRRPHFQGSLDDLRAVRAAVELPVLRKDFIIDPYQVIEARAAGADAVLLIAECLDDAACSALLHDPIVELGMTPLVELVRAGEPAAGAGRRRRGWWASTTATCGASAPTWSTRCGSAARCPPTAASSAKAASARGRTSAAGGGRRQRHARRRGAGDAPDIAAAVDELLGISA